MAKGVNAFKAAVRKPEGKGPLALLWMGVFFFFFFYILNSVYCDTIFTMKTKNASILLVYTVTIVILYCKNLSQRK